MSQNYTWPSVSVTATNPSVGINGTTAPGSSTEVAGINQSNGNLQPLQTDSAGNLLVTPAPGSTGNVNLTEVGGAAISLGQKLEAASLPVVLPSDQVVPISASALPLPAGASTSALQTSGNSSLTSINANQTNGTQTTSVLNFPATQPVSGTVTVVQPTAANLNATVVGTVTANQGTSPWSDNIAQYGGVATSLGQKVSASSIPVVLASDETVPISAASLPLPTGAATSANQTTMLSRLTGSLVPTAYDEVVLNYVGATTDFSTVVFKLATVTVKTLTFTYDGSDRLTDVVAS